MEKAKQVGCSSSSFTMDLFGPKEPSTSPPLLGSIFAPQISSKEASTSTPSHSCGNSKNDPIASKGSNLSNTVDPGYYNSSIYYGAREMYPSTNPNASPPRVLNKDGGDADPNESNSNCASRGNWWKGSLYY